MKNKFDVNSGTRYVVRSGKQYLKSDLSLTTDIKEAKKWVSFKDAQNAALDIDGLGFFIEIIGKE